MGEELEKYQKLKVRESLCLCYRYPLACRELGAILRLAYSKSPNCSKPLQSRLLEDTITAFRLLPQVQTQSALSAANFLSQSAEAVLPKQKRVLLATEFKQAKIVCKRRSKTKLEDKDLVQLPQDVLVHLFSFLDIPSLGSAGMVCRSWNAAAVDNYLWKLHYSSHFGDSESILKKEGLQGGVNVTGEERQNAASNGDCEDAKYNWKDAFRRAYLGLPSWRYKYTRGYCGLCNSIVWLSNLHCPNKHWRQGSRDQQLKPLSPAQIVRYIFLSSSFLNSSYGDSDGDSDSDIESDEYPSLKFWTYSTSY